MRFITDSHRLNQQLVRNQYQSPRIDEIMQQLEGFQYSTALYTNMGYYTIRISPASQDMKTIVTEFGKFKNTIASLWACGLRDISSKTN